MSRKGHAIGNRLGISKDWVSHFGSFKVGENIKKSFFIRQWLINMLSKLSVWFLSMRIIQRKNFMDIHILICYLNSVEPKIHNNYFLQHVVENWYWKPVTVGFLKVPYAPENKYRTRQLARLRFKFLQNKYRKFSSYQKFFIKVLEFYLEDKLKDVVKVPVKIRLYNIIDYYNVYDFNMITTYVIVIMKLFPREQRKLFSSIKTSIFYLTLGIIRKNSFLIAKVFALGLQRYKRPGELLNFFFKIIREVFYLIPLKSETEEVIRGEYLKIQISGKISGRMRAVKKIYSFSHYKGKQVPIQTLNKDVSYSLSEAYTYAGVLGIKVWIC